jgi:hypothetical protein
VDTADERHRQRVEQLEQPREVFRVAQVVLTAVRDGLHHPGEIRSGAEHRTFAREHDRSQRVIPDSVTGKPRQRSDDLLVERVPDVGAIEADAQDARFVVAAGRREDGHQTAILHAEDAEPGLG